jgi:serine/threonine protein kinase
MLKQGGMGVCYLASDNSSGSDVIVKEPLLGIASERTNIEKLKVEADVLEQLHHKNIVRFVDRSPPGSTFYLVEEYIDGEVLDDTFWNRPADEREVHDYIVQTLDALSYMHEKPRLILHRDLCPSNVMLTRTADIKLIDFGTAKYYYTSMDVTHLIEHPGGYTAPEQKRTGLATPLSDIYSAGATLYFLLTGKPPDYCRTTKDDLRPPSDVNSQADPTLSGVAMKAMADDPGDRYQTAEDMRTAIENGRIIGPPSYEACIIYGSTKYAVGDEATVGRANDCDIMLTDPTPPPTGPFISSHHCKIYKDKGQYWIMDMQSRNGTYIVLKDKYGQNQYRKLTHRTPWALQDNDTIALCYDDTLGPYVLLTYQAPR